jgi:putative ABC transport system substrate-binding protein
MRRREFITLVGSAAAAWPLAARAQQMPRTPVIGVLAPLSAQGAARNIEALRSGLREFGYVDGRNAHLEYRYADGILARLPALAAELVVLKPDVILAGSPAGALAVRDATQTIPILAITVLDPVALGLVQSIARPGGNVTALSVFGSNALVGKRLELLKEIVPSLSRVGVMVDPSDPSDDQALGLLREAARALGILLRTYEVREPAILDATFEQAAGEHMQGVFVNQNPFFFNLRAKVVAAATRVRLPAIYGFREFVDLGGLMSYSSSLPAAYRQAARLIDKMLKGASPAELPVEQATKFELVINLQTVRTLGLAVPPTLLVRADQVIE